MWFSQIRWATVDLSGPYRNVFGRMLPGAAQVGDPLRVVELANTKVDKTRPQGPERDDGHRGRKTDPLYRIRRLLTKADARLTVTGLHQTRRTARRRRPTR